MTANYSAEYASSGWKIGNLTSYYASNNLVLGSGFGSGGSTLETDGDVFIGGNLHIIGNISNTDITHLNINGSLFPSLDAMFDLGNNSLRWQDGNLSGTLQAGTLSDGSGATITGGVVDAPSVKVSGSIVQVEGAAWKLTNFTTAYGNGYASGGFDNENFTTRYDARADRFLVANFTSNLNTQNASLWNASGSNIYLKDQAGKVGIGKTSPTEILEVQGNIRVSGNVTGTSFSVNETATSVVLVATGNKRLILTTDPSSWT